MLLWCSIAVNRSGIPARPVAVGFFWRPSVRRRGDSRGIAGRRSARLWARPVRWWLRRYRRGRWVRL